MLGKTCSRPLSFPRRGTWIYVGLLAFSCLLALAVVAGNAFAGQLPVRLGKADNFAVLAGQTVTSAGVSTLDGDLGVSPGTSLTGFPPGMVNAKAPKIHAADPVASQAQSDLTAAYNDAAGRSPPQALPADVGGRTLAPGVYKSGSTLGLTGSLTLDGKGDRNAVFVFQVGSALTTAVASGVRLVNGAKACNVFWQIGSSATLGTSSFFVGNVLAYTSISMNDRVTLDGRALARNGGVTLINDNISAAHCETVAPPPPVAPPNEPRSSPAISGNGRYVAFASTASNLVANDTNGESDIFARDRELGITRRVSVGRAGVQADGVSVHPSISEDGRYVAFESSATNLVPGDANGVADVFVYDRALGTLERASVSDSQGQLALGGTAPDISGDGRYVAFVTKSAAVPSANTCLGQADNNGVEDVYIYDRTRKKAVQQASASTGTAKQACGSRSITVTRAGNAASLNPVLSASGRYVAFQSAASNLVGGDTNGATDVFVRDRSAGRIWRASVSNKGKQANGGSSDPSISADGSYVAFASEASNLVTKDYNGALDSDTNGRSDVFRYHRTTRTSARVSASGGRDPNGASYQPSISANGNLVAFASDVTNQEYFPDKNGVSDIEEWHADDEGNISHLSYDDQIGRASGRSHSPAISGDGSTAAFVSDSSNFASIIPGAAPEGDVVYVHKTTTTPDGQGHCTILLASRAADLLGEAANPNEDREKKGPLHHIATDKNGISSARGGPWTPRFKMIFDRARVSLNDKANLVNVPGHFGPHREEYHQIVFDTLEEAVGTKTGAGAARALRKALKELAEECRKPGTPLNDLLTKRKPKAP